MMESPLDVLSRAASMVETSSRNEALLRPSSPDDYNPHRSSPGKELPTKLSKLSRLRDRQEVTSAVDADRERLDRLSAIKKTASTQTQLSGFPHDNLVVPPPPPYFTTHDTILRDGTTTTSSHHHRFHGYNNYSNNNNNNLPPPPPPPPPPHLHLPPPPPFSQSISTSPQSSPSSSQPPLSSSLSTSSSSYSTSTSRVSLYPPAANTYSESPHHASSSPLTSINPNTTSTPPTKQSFPNQDISTAAIPPHPISTPSSCPSSKNNSLHVNIYAQNGASPPPPPQYKDLTRPRVAEGVQDTPLNLVVKASVGCTSPSQKGITKHKKSWIQRNGNTHEADPEDDAIEEHFRRSLGQKYVENSSSSSSSSPKSKYGVDASSMTTMSALTSSPPSYDKTMTSAATIQAMETEGVHITGSVDDHFARALGDQMWTAIKARSEPPTPEADPDTVDAHFAKALGASMWKKLQKADTEVVDRLSPTDHTKHNLHHPPRGDTHYPHHQSPKHPPSPIRPQLAM